MSAADVARALRGHRSADGYLCRCPVPGHGRGRGDRNPSLLVKDGDTALLVTCFGGCDPRDVLDELRRLGLLDDAPAGAYCPPLVPAASEPVEHLPNADALALWRAAVEVEGTLAERYLIEHRGLGTEKPFPQTLRFASEVVYPNIGLHYRFPALLAVVQAPDRRKIAVQATFLRASDGKKAPLANPRLTIGSLGHGAVRLGPIAGETLGLAEGVEDALAAQKLTGTTCWAVLGAARMHRVFIPPEVRELHVFADDDETGRLAAERTAARHVAEGRKVMARLAPDGFKDWAEAAAERCPS